MATIDNAQTEWTPKVGDRVSIAWGVGRISAVITENRGPLAGGGRTLWRVRAAPSPKTPFYTALPVEEMQPLPVVQRAKRVIGRRKVAAR